MDTAWLTRAVLGLTATPIDDRRPPERREGLRNPASAHRVLSRRRAGVRDLDYSAVVATILAAVSAPSSADG
jgi:hypothetical protein